MSVIEKDFGKSRRDASRTLCRLLGLLEAQQQELQDDPLRLFGMAGKEISRLQGILRDAEDSLRMRTNYMPDDSEPVYLPAQTVRITHDDYERLKECARIVRSWNLTHAPHKEGR